MISMSGINNYIYGLAIRPGFIYDKPIYWLYINNYSYNEYNIDIEINEFKKILYDI